ncbi:MAG: glycosyltransferase family 2 protein [Arenicella sp.]
MIKYSVIIPTFNRKNLLIEAIHSVLRQVNNEGNYFQGIEIIVIDDGSTDGTYEAVQRFGRQCRYVFQKNKGPSAARNTGIKLAQGEFIAFLDSDDLWFPCKVQHELNLFFQYEDIDVLAGNAESYVESQLRTNSVFRDRGVEFNQRGVVPFCWTFPIMALGPVCITSSMTFRKTVFEKMHQPVFDEKLRLDEDWDFEFRLFSQANALLFEKVVCQIRAYDDGTRNYSIWGQEKSKEEQHRIWQMQVLILDRYLNCVEWNHSARAQFLRRRNELHGFICGIA